MADVLTSPDDWTIFDHARDESQSNSNPSSSHHRRRPSVIDTICGISPSSTANNVGNDQGNDSQNSEKSKDKEDKDNAAKDRGARKEQKDKKSNP